MKKNFILISIIAALLVVIGAVLANNKSIIDSRVTRDTITEYPVNITEVKQQTVSRNAEYVGTTAAVNDIELLSETQGRVISAIISNGSKVSKGTLIAQVDDEMIKAQFTLAESALEKSKKDLRRYENLFAEGNLSINDLENARVSVKNADAQFVIAKKSLENTRITSPITGILTNRYINSGSTVAPGTPVANIVDISKLKVTIPVPEKDLKYIERGSVVRVYCEMFSDKEFSGSVTSLGVKADNAHNYPVEITMNNTAMNLTAGMFVRVKFLFTTSEQCLVIPRTALTGSARDGKIYTVENGTARRRNIIVTGTAGDMLEIRGDVAKGDKVVISGQNNLEDGAKVFLRTAAN